MDDSFMIFVQETRRRTRVNSAHSQNTVNQTNKQTKVRQQQQHLEMPVEPTVERRQGYLEMSAEQGSSA